MGDVYKFILDKFVNENMHKEIQLIDYTFIPIMIKLDGIVGFDSTNIDFSLSPINSFQSAGLLYRFVCLW